MYCTNEAETGEENKECADGIPNGKYSIAKHAYVWDMRLGAKECRNK